MGRVWLARDGSLGRQIALKELRPDQSDNSIVCSRFLYEAKITAQLEHPGIVPVYELGEGDAPYYTMRFVRGRTLSEAIRAYHKKRAAGEADSVGLVDLLLAFVSVCHAVAYAHSRGIIHRDLKGQNVVLGDFGEVIVLDWGLAKRVGPDPARQARSRARAADRRAPADRLDPEAATAVTCAAGRSDDGFTAAPTIPTAPTSAALDPGAADRHGLGGLAARMRLGRRVRRESTGSNGSAHLRPSSSARRGLPESGAGPEGTMQGQLLGTPAYMAPEQARARHDLVDQRTDIYGLGAILYEILDRPPAVRRAEDLRGHPEGLQRGARPRRARSSRRSRPGLEAVCLKALRKEKADRYQSAAELAQEVRRYLADEPVEAYAEPWTRRAARWARRNRTKVAAAAAPARDRDDRPGRQHRAGLPRAERGRGPGPAGTPRPSTCSPRAPTSPSTTSSTRSRRRSSRTPWPTTRSSPAGPSSDPAVRLEHGRAYQQMGDIQRKLGRLGDSEAAYRQAIAMLEPLAGAAGAGREAKRSLARTRTLLGDLLVRRGADKGQAGPLYAPGPRGAARPGRRQAGPGRHHRGHPPPGPDLQEPGRPAAARRQVRRGQAGLRPGHRRARAGARPPTPSTPRPATSWRWPSTPAAGSTASWATLAAAEADYRRAVELLEKLVAEFPTMPRHREALARACNSLGLARAGHRPARRRRDPPAAASSRWRSGWPRTSPTAPSTAACWPGRLSNLGIVLSAPAPHRRGRADPPPRHRGQRRDLRQVARRRPDPLRPGQGPRLPGRSPAREGGHGAGDRVAPGGAGDQREAGRGVPRPAPLSQPAGGEPRRPGPGDAGDRAGPGRGAVPGRAGTSSTSWSRPIPTTSTIGSGRRRACGTRGPRWRRPGRPSGPRRSTGGPWPSSTPRRPGPTPEGMRLKAEVLNNLGDLLRAPAGPRPRPSSARRRACSRSWPPGRRRRSRTATTWRSPSTTWARPCSG